MMAAGILLTGKKTGQGAEMETITVKCPHCGKPLSVTEEDAGRTRRCPACADFFKIKSLERCPCCGRRSFEKKKICVNCGYNFETCERMRTLTGEEAEQADPGLLLKFLLYLSEACPGVFHFSRVLAFFFCCLISLAVAFLSLFFLLLGVYITGVVILGIGVLVYMHGVAFLCADELCTLKNAFEYIQGKSWNCFLFLTFFPVAAIMLAMGILGRLLS